MSCNLPRCKGTPERTTCGKNQREERALPRSQNPRLRAKNEGACAALREQSFLEQLPPNGNFSTIASAIACVSERARQSYPSRSSVAIRDRTAPGLSVSGSVPAGPARRPRECSSQCSARHYRNNRRRHTLIKRTHHTRDPSSHAT